MTKIIEIKNISYDNIFNKFNISFPMEKLIYLSGPNNCGKTTLIRTLDRKNDSKISISINNKELNTLNLLEYYKTIKCLIPKEIELINNTVQEEIDYHNKKLIDEQELIKRLKLTRLKKAQINSLGDKELIKLQLLISLLSKPKVLFIDNIMSYFNKEEIKELNDLLKDYIKEYKTTIIITTIDLNNTIYSDYLIIINDNKIVLEGEPLEVLEKDNIINKVNLDLPFMIDLSSKLRDYDLIKEIEIDKESLINKLWK